MAPFFAAIDKLIAKASGARGVAGSLPAARLIERTVRSNPSDPACFSFLALDCA